MCLCVHNGNHHEMMTRQTTITRQRWATITLNIETTNTLSGSLSSFEHGTVYRNRTSNRIIIFSHGSRRMCVLTLFMWIQSEYAEQQKKNKKTKNKKKIKKKKKKKKKQNVKAQ